MTGYRGIIDYEPTELVVSARAGTPLDISLTTFEPLTAELIARAEAAGIHRLIVFPMAAGDALERTVREIGAQFGTP